MTDSIRTQEYRTLLSKLRNARIKAGFSQREVAEKFGKPQSYISKVESGERRVDVIEVKKFAAIYKVSVSELIP